MSTPDQFNGQITDYGSPLQVLGRVSSLSKYNNAQGVVQLLTDSNGIACALVSFGRSSQAKGNEVKLIPLSAFSRVPVMGDEIRIDVGEEREGDQRRFVRRALESVGVLKQSTKIFAVVTSSASEQDPGQNPHVEWRPEASRHQNSEPLTRVLAGIDRVISRVAETFSAVVRAVSAFRRPAKSVALNEEPAEVVVGKRIAERDAGAGAAGLVEITASEVPRLEPGPAAPQATKDARVPQREKRMKYTDLGSPLPQRVLQAVPSELAEPQRIQYETPIIEKPEPASRIAGTSRAAQPRISVWRTDAPRRYAEHDAPQSQRGTWVGIPRPQPQRAIIQEPVRIAIEGGEKARLYTVRTIPQVAQRGLWATEAGKEITPQARTQAARSKEDVRAIAVEQARQHAQTHKSQDQEKRSER